MFCREAHRLARLALPQNGLAAYLIFSLRAATSSIDSAAAAAQRDTLYRPGGTVIVNAIHLDEVPAFPYRLLWEERGIRSVANVTRRDAKEFLELAAAIPIRTSVRTYPLDQANAALADLKSGAVGASAAVLVTDGG